MSDIYYPCILERSEINGNYTLWLPEQDGLIQMVEEEYSQSQGSLWHALILAAAELKCIDISSVYVEPEGDVFVCYAKNAEILTLMVGIFLDLTNSEASMLTVFEHAKKIGALKKFDDLIPT